jgi:hypothetical protein
LPMNDMIAFCGLICTDCPAFLATQNDDDNKRRETAALWSEQYGMALQAKDINCDGCLSDTGRLIGHCNVCDIRKCGRQKQVENCAGCDDYSCDRLEDFFKVAPHTKRVLDDIRSTR